MWRRHAAGNFSVAKKRCHKNFHKPLKNTFPVEMKILYNETLEESDFKVTYGGEKYNPLEDADDLSVAILNGIIKMADHKFAEKNILNLKCK